MSTHRRFATLPEDLLCYIGGFLPIPDVLRLSGVAHDWHALLASPSADLAVWRAHVWALLAGLFPDPEAAPSADLAHWNVSSYRRLCTVLHRCRRLLGRWRWDAPVRGGLLVVALDVAAPPYCCIVADLVVPNQCSTLMVKPVTEFHSAPLFELHFSDYDYCLTTDGVGVAEDDTKLAVASQAVLDLADDLPYTSYLQSLDFAPLLREYLQGMAVADLVFHRLPGPRRPPPGKSLGLPGPQPRDLVGLYEGLFGPHGLEVVHLSLHDGQLQGLKVTGDPYVPAGQLCFRSVGPLEAGVAHPCKCQHGCGCWTPTDIADGWEVVGSLAVEARTASHGFFQPHWNAGHLQVCQRAPGGPRRAHTDRPAAGPQRFLILCWDGLFSTRLCPLPW
eukprot:EG_transcript_5085